MAPCGDAKLVFCIFLIAFCTVCQTQIAIDCCLRVKDKPIHKTIAADYRQQVAGQGCAIDATIFVTRRGRNLCVPPHASWVPDLKKHVIELKRWCKNHSYKGNRCFGVRHE